MKEGAFDRVGDEKRQAILSAGIYEFARSAYSDASTDDIVKRCGISKGLLFHYFGSKKAFYLYCLKSAMDRLTQPPRDESEGGFYEVLFSVMDEKLRLCERYPDETLLVNMASRENAAEVAADKAALIASYSERIRGASDAVLARAIAHLPIGSRYESKAREGLALYCRAIINKYLLQYQSRPEAFFKDADAIKADIREYIDIMLYGIIREDGHEKA